MRLSVFESTAQKGARLLDISLDVLLDRFLDFESTHPLTRRRIGNVFAWPIVRSPLLVAMTKHWIMQSFRGPVKKPFERRSSAVERIWSGLRSRPTMSVPESRLLGITASSLRRFGVHSEEWVDIIYDRYAEVLPELLLLEQPSATGHHSPRSSRRLYDLDHLLMLAQLGWRVRWREAREVRDFMHRVADELRKRGLVFPQAVYARGTRVLAKGLAMDRLWPRLLDKVKPAMVLLHCASYGGIRAALCRRCHERDIKTAEVQHGVINRYHGAYNYAPNYGGEFSAYLPDYFLGFSKTWLKEVPRFPVRQLAVGTPMWDDSQSVPSDPEDSRVLLVVSQPTVTELLSDFVAKLVEYLPTQYTVVYRPHPREDVPDKVLRRLRASQRVTVDGGEPLQNQLANARLVVGVYSTALFEALLAGRPVMALDTPSSRAYLPQKLVQFISRPDQIVQVISEPASMAPGVSSLKGPDWRSGIAHFIRDLL